MAPYLAVFTLGVDVKDDPFHVSLSALMDGGDEGGPSPVAEKALVADP
tara:strand:- start:60 stop:203 length:144 start_codon:yes stop_codon:yes gene_type:complete